jgi:lipopolysaccharide/colanic/teichoic acid biosynthesis glycosyltransferase
MYPGKRILDWVIALPVSMITCIFTPFIGLAIIVESGLPIFVHLERVSGGELIRVWKFRTMVRGAHNMKLYLADLNERKDGPLFKIKNDPRLTRVGKFLRKLRLDEFPQSWNVLSGDLSLVGPRPHEPGEIAKYPPEFKRIAEAKSGLTGLSQVMGASNLPFQKELEYDLEYINHPSFGLDLKVLWKTLVIFLSDPTGV